jgi:hypothetical protein
MALPDTVRVKISSEEGGYLSVTPVVVREMPLKELLELMLEVTGRDAGRIHEILLRGTLVSGASRFRWEGWRASPGEVEALLDEFPGPEPSRRFAPQGCTLAILRSESHRVAVPREAALKRRMLRRNCFWEELLAAAGAGSLHYLEFSHREKADVYRTPLSPQLAAGIAFSGRLIASRSLRDQVRRHPATQLDLYVPR